MAGDFSEIDSRGHLGLLVPNPPRVVTRTAEDKVAAIRSTWEVGDGDSTPCSLQVAKLGSMHHFGSALKKKSRTVITIETNEIWVIAGLLSRPLEW